MNKVIKAILTAIFFPTICIHYFVYGVNLIDELESVKENEK